MGRMILTCTTCGVDCGEHGLAAHLAEIAERRARYGDGWQFEARTYRVVDTDVVAGSREQLNYTIKLDHEFALELADLRDQDD